MKKGFVHVYTGAGKGKTTAAFGLAVRALGQGMRVLVVQFIKGGAKPSGEVSFMEAQPGAEVIRFKDQRHPMFCKTCDTARLARSVRDGFALARRKAAAGLYDMVVLDEVNNCMKEGWLAVSDVAALIAERPAGVELVLTGRGCPDEILTLADYVTEVRLVKHPAESGVKARKGVEY